MRNSCSMTKQRNPCSRLATTAAAAAASAALLGSASLKPAVGFVPAAPLPTLVAVARGGREEVMAPAVAPRVAGSTSRRRGRVSRGAGGASSWGSRTRMQQQQVGGEQERQGDESPSAAAVAAATAEAISRFESSSFFDVGTDAADDEGEKEVATIEDGREEHTNPEVEKALRLLDTMEEFGQEMDTSVFISAMKACVAAADLATIGDIKARCRRVVEGLGGNGIPEVVYNAAISCFVEAGDVDKALQTIDEMEAADVPLGDASVGLIVLALVGAGDLRRTLTILSTLRAQRIKLDIDTYNQVMELCVAKGRLSDAMTLIEGMVTVGVDPTTPTYNGAITLASREDNRAQETLSLFGQMKLQGLDGDAVSYAAAISSCADGVRWERALMMLEEMQKVGIKPSSACYAAAIRACTAAGKRLEAVKVLELLVELTPELADASCFLAALEGFVVGRDDVKNPKKKLQQQAVVIVAPTDEKEKKKSGEEEEGGLDGRKEQEKKEAEEMERARFSVEDVMKLFRSVPPQIVDVTHYNAALRALCKCGAWQQAAALLQEMREGGGGGGGGGDDGAGDQGRVVPTTDSFNAVVEAYIGAGLRYDAGLLLKEMEAAAVAAADGTGAGGANGGETTATTTTTASPAQRPDLETYRLVVQGCAKDKDRAMVVRIASQLETEEAAWRQEKPDAHFYQTAVLSFLPKGEEEEEIDEGEGEGAWGRAAKRMLQALSQAGGSGAGGDGEGVGDGGLSPSIRMDAFVGCAKACGEAKDVTGALLVLELVKVYKVSPPLTAVYNAVIEACCLGDKVDAAKTLLRRMKLYRVDRDGGSYGPIVRKLCEYAVKRSVKEGRAETEVLLLQSRAEEAGVMLWQMVNEGITTDPDVYNTLAVACIQGQAFELAEDVMAAMSMAGVVPAESTLDAIRAAETQENAEREARGETIEDQWVHTQEPEEWTALRKEEEKEREEKRKQQEDEYGDGYVDEFRDDKDPEGAQKRREAAQEELERLVMQAEQEHLATLAEAQQAAAGES